MNKIGVLGIGAWGTAIGKLLCENGHVVSLWSHSQELEETVNSTHRHPMLPDVVLPETLSANTDLGDVIYHSDYLVFAIASNFIDVIKDIDTHYKGQPMLVLTKGLLEGKNTPFVSQYIQSILGPDTPIAILSGPNLALEVARSQLGATTIASATTIVSSTFQTLLSSDQFRVYTSDDVMGVTLGGIVKNVLAVAAGICDGLSLGQNAKSALMTRGLQEMIRIGTHYGAKPDTFIGLSGIGDLITTCCSEKSRNWQTGNALAKGEPLAAIAQRLNAVAEGVKAAKLLVEVLADTNIEIPIIQEVYTVLYEGKNPKLAIKDLMARKLIAET